MTSHLEFEARHSLILSELVVANIIVAAELCHAKLIDMPGMARAGQSVTVFPSEPLKFFFQELFCLFFLFGYLFSTIQV